METLPVETFQLICSFCSLHVLASLRLVSKGFRDRVDGSLTARRSHAAPTIAIPRDVHDTNGCYIRVTLNRLRDPITVVFDRYHLQHNYLEFVQHSEPAVLESLGTFTVNAGPIPQMIQPQATATNVYLESTLGKLDFNLWDEQRTQFKSVAPPSLLSTPVEGPATGESSASVMGRGGRRSSITQASLIRGTEHLLQQELSSSGPITPLAQTRPVRNAMTSSFGMSSSSSGVLPSTLPRDSHEQGESFMARFARMVLGSTATDSQLTQTLPGMSAAERIEEARQLMHTIEPEVLPSKKEYKFKLSEGAHYMGDNDFIMRYTIMQDALSRRLFKVDYIRVSWRWITSGIPVVTTKSISHHDDPMAMEDPFPQQRIGRIYAERYNRLLQEIRKQELDQFMRGKLAMEGYDASVLPRDFISIDLRSEPIVKWITRLDQDDIPRFQPLDEPGEASPKEVLLDESSSRSLNIPLVTDDSTTDSDWEDLSLQGGDGQGKDRGKDNDKDEAIHQVEEGSASKIRQDEEDREALEELLQSIKQNLGFLSARNILEEMLAAQGYSRDLIWKYGIVRRELMGAIPEIQHAKQLLQKIVSSETRGKGTAASM
ncbi:hypothetical protein BGX34_005819 [Mortierella sp. NVP85]|nr:hypothetical protein BGX34_005819 [Mortierella sp. NVP85]